MKALHIHAGEQARRHIEAHGLRPRDVRLVPAAAGGPKGLILNHLDRHILGQWLPQGGHTVHLVGASIGAWRVGAAAMQDPVAALHALASGYITQNVEPEPGRRFPSPQRITAGFTETISRFFGAHVPGMLRHPSPKLGEHTVEILARIGVGNADLDKLLSQGLI